MCGRSCAALRCALGVAVQLRCRLCKKTFVNPNLLEPHFQKSHKKEFKKWWKKVQVGAAA